MELGDRPTDPQQAIKPWIRDIAAQRLFGDEPRRVGPYRITGHLGSGGMGTVLEGVHQTLGRTAAIKLLNAPATGRGAEAQPRLLLEARALASLSHPNIVAIYDVGASDSGMYIAMEKVEGMSLRDWLDEGEHGWRRVLDVLCQAGRGLAAAHEQGLVHRDFKPENVIVGEDGRARVLDFGLVRDETLLTTERPGHEAPGPSPLLSSVRLTQAGTTMGTPLYMSPEQHTAGEVGPAADQFAFCTTLFEGLYGRRPFAGRTITELRRAVLAGVVRPTPRMHRVPRRIRRAVLRGLNRDPALRFPSMDALLHALRERRRGRLFFAVGVASVLGLAGVHWGFGESAKIDCAETGQAIVARWTAQRPQVERALRSTELPFADKAATDASATLTGYATSLAEAHTTGCAAQQRSGHVGGVTGCLHRRRRAFEAAVNVLEAADADVATSTWRILADLRSPGSCLDARLSLERGDEETPRVASVREGIAAIHALQLAGKPLSGLRSAANVVARARALDRPELLAEALAEAAQLQTDAGDYKAALPRAREAYFVASEARAYRTMLDAALQLTYLLGWHLGRFEEGLQWAEHANAVAGESPDPLAAVRIDAALAVIAGTRGDHEETLRLDGRALAVVERELGPRSAKAVPLLIGMANAATSLGDAKSGRRYAERSLVVLQQTHGDSHPDVAAAHTSLSNMFSAGGNWDEALHHAQRARTIWEGSLGPEHPSVAGSLINIGNIHTVRGDFDEALSRYRTALPILVGASGPDHPDVANVHNNMGSALLGQGNREDALRHYKQGLAIAEANSGPQHPETALNLHNIALVLAELDRVDEAMQYAQRAVDLYRTRFGRSHPASADALVLLGAIMLGVGDYDGARETLLPALAILEERGQDPIALAEARFAVGRLQWESGDDRRAARRFVEASRRDAEDVAIPQAEKMQRWLDDHPLRG